MVQQELWLEQYPPTIPYEIDTNRYPSLVNLLEEALARSASKVLCTCLDREYTYADINEHSQLVATWLQNKKLKPASKVAIMLPNLPQYIIIMIGILRAGYICVPISPTASAESLRHQLMDSGASVIFALDTCMPTLQSVLQDTMVQRLIITNPADMLGYFKRRLQKLGKKSSTKSQKKYLLSDCSIKLSKLKHVFKAARTLSYQAAEPHPESLAFLYYTSGSTGLPKGAMLTHKNIIAATLQGQTWFYPVVHKLPNEQINTVMALPLCHIFSTMVAFFSIQQGYSLLMVPNARNTQKFIDTLSKYPFHIMPGVDAMFQQLLNTDGFDQLDFSNLVISQSAAMVISHATAKRWKEVTGNTMIEGWGMTESTAIGISNFTDNNDFTGTLGYPMPNVELSILNGKEQMVDVNGTGELCIKGPNVSIGYYNQDNRDYFTHDGFFKTGDIVCVQPNGQIKLLDRKKDIIQVSGFHVYPSEVEQIIKQMPGVEDCGVIGATDEEGESIHAFITLSDPNIKKMDIRQHCSKCLVSYKRPSYLHLVDELPKSTLGSVMRKPLRDDYLPEQFKNNG